ncbi:unnamed protein product [Plutella xylostella]|uniref:(diamondback moth) hypothetical protein n=1 Tax=Plutella xylostella TaxID=51655 RepID=A0A8S4E2T1_PLUXY|nr:unnamed protein product [Plutella xylostella]
MLDRLEQDRKLMLFQHLGFVHCPMREHCPAQANCLDSTLPVILNTKVCSLTSTGESQGLAGPPAAPWALTTDSNQIKVIILGLEGVANEFGSRLLAGCDAAQCCRALGGSWRVTMRVRTDHAADDNQSNGYFCVYQDQDSFEFIRACAEKTLLSSLEQEDKLPFQGLPLVVMFIQDEGMDKKEMMRLQEEGQNLAENLHGSYMDASITELGTEALTSDAIQEMIRANRDKASYAHLYRDVIVCFDSDIRIMVCMFCDDPYSPERVLSPLLSHRACFLTGDRSVVLETFLGDSKRKVERVLSPLLSHRACFLTGDRSVVLETFLGDSKRKVERVLSPLLSHRACFLTGDRSVVLETFLGDSKRKVEVRETHSCDTRHTTTGALLPERVLSPLLSHRACFLTGDRFVVLETFLGDSKRKVEVRETHSCDTRHTTTGALLPERVLSPLLSHRACFLTGDRSVVLETFLGDSKRKVEVRETHSCDTRHTTTGALLPERVLSPLLSHRACFLTGDRSVVLETFLGDSKRKVEVRETHSCDTRHTTTGALLPERVLSPLLSQLSWR